MMGFATMNLHMQRHIYICNKQTSRPMKMQNWKELLFSCFQIWTAEEKKVAVQSVEITVVRTDRITTSTPITLYTNISGKNCCWARKQIRQTKCLVCVCV